jgi:hypothetical protein
VNGPEHIETLATMQELADLYSAHKDYTKAESTTTALAEARRHTLGPQHAETVGTFSGLGLVRIQAHRYGEAEAVIREVLATRKKTIPDDWRRYNSECMLGESLAGQGKYAEAETLLLSGYAGLKERESSIPPESKYNLENARAWIAQLYKDWGKPEKAAAPRR